MATNYDNIYTKLLMSTSSAAEAMGRAIDAGTQIYKEAGEDALKYLGQQFGAGQAYLTPYRLAGEQSVGTLQNLLGVNGQAAQTKAINGIITPALQSMQQFGQNTANQAMAQFLGVVAPGYNLAANAGAIAAASSNIPGVSSSIAKMSRDDAKQELNSLTARYNQLNQDSTNISVRNDLKSEINQLNARLGNGFYNAQGKYQDFVRLQDAIGTGGYFGNQSDTPFAANSDQQKLKDYIQANNLKPDSIVSGTELNNLIDKVNYNSYVSSADTSNNFLPAFAQQGQTNGIQNRLTQQQSYLSSNPNYINGTGQYTGPGSESYDAANPNTSTSNTSGGAINTSGMMGNIVDMTTQNPLVTKMMDYLQEQGQRSYQDTAASKGMLNSGRALAELQKQGQGLAATNVMPLVNNLMTQILQGVSGIQEQYVGSTMSGAASLAGQSIGAVQSGLSNLIQQGNTAAQASGQLAAQQAQLGSGIKMDVGKYSADARILQGKVQSDALNAMAQIQFSQDMGPYAKNLLATPQASGYTTVGGSGFGGLGG